MNRANKDIGGTVRSPRAIVRVGPWGSQQSVTGWVNCEVVNNNLSGADTFHVTFATSMLPKGFDVNWFSQQQDMYVEILMGLPADPNNYTASDLTSLIFGQVDRIEYDPVNFLLDLSGRDLTRVFIDTKSTVKYSLLTSSQIATTLAQKHGLTAKVTQTKVPVGKYYDLDHVTMTDERSDWDLLLYLAQVEDFEVYVRGQTLYFNPKRADVRATQPVANPYVIEWIQPTAPNMAPSANVQTLQFTRALTVSRGIQVLVRSWNQRQAKGFTAAWPSSPKTTQIGKATPFGNSQVYVRTFPNLTQDQALQKAKALYEAIVQHEMRFEAELPGDVILDTGTTIQVTGTGTAYDQTYYPDSITRRMEWDGGFTMVVTAKNMAPETQAFL